jgi:hypothetical protein
LFDLGRRQTLARKRQTHPKSNNIAGASSAASSLIRFCIPDIGPDQGLVVGASWRFSSNGGVPINPSVASIRCSIDFGAGL